MAYYLTSPVHPELITMPINITCHKNGNIQNGEKNARAFGKHNHSVTEILYMTEGELFAIPL